MRKTVSALGCAMGMLLGGVLAVGAAAAQTGPATPRMFDLPARAVVAPVRPCESLTALDLSDLDGAPTEIFATEVQAAEGAVAEYCRVEGYVAPTIRFELRLPTQGYTGRYLQLGCGANCGEIRFRASPRCDNAMAMSGAFAVAATDTGHTGNSRSTLWARDNLPLQQDFAEWGAVKVAIASKAIVEAYYGQAPAYSYFQGCSDGGREAMIMAQRHPDMFDGVIAGAPANYLTSAFLRYAWQQHHGRDADGRLIITPTAAATLHAAVMTACDGLDGAEDGQIDDPRVCAFDPRTIACAGGPEQPGRCISAAQAATAAAFYRGAVDENGQPLSLGGQSPGSELMWPNQLDQSAVVNFFRDMIYGSRRPGLGLSDITFTTSTLNEVMRLGAHYEAYDPDLRRFRDAGGKMIVWEGAADTAAGPHAVLNYYQKVRDMMGGLERTQETVRLFMLPGVYHCGNGYMPYEANFLGAIVNWIEADRTPDMVEATANKPEGDARVRPVFPYPATARYVGQGDMDRPENFRRHQPAGEPDDRYDWAGGK